MVKRTHENWLAGWFFLAIMLLAVMQSAYASDRQTMVAKKLFPRLTDGIYNANNQLVMNCKIADDGLTISDAAWNTYLPPAGKGKRWNFNQTPYNDTPLINYKFPDQFAGLQVNITVEIYNLAKPWEVSETYQETLQLGGKQRIGLPDWFRLPQDRLAFDFEEGKWFPSGWSLPKGKFACWEGAGKKTQADRSGRHPMLDFGFTHVAENTFSKGGSTPPWENQCRVFGDAEWLDMSDGCNQDKWHNDGWKSRGSRMQIVIPDFENGCATTWDQAHYDKFREMVTDFNQSRPNCYLGCWGVGVTKYSLRIFDEIDPNGRPTGVVNLKAAAQWKAKYDNPQAELQPIFNNCGLTFGNPSVYWLNGGNPAHLYAVVQEWEVGKLAKPNTPNIISTWIQTEFVDGYPLTSYRFNKLDGSVRTEWMKHQAPPSLVYAFSLFAHARMDGAYCWETGNGYSEDPSDPGYYIKYFGFYNYHVLGMWQASRNKDIIEASTEWFMPEIWTSTNNVWRTGENRYPSYCNYYKEPLVRAKYSANGKELLVIACNPYNKGVQTLKVKDPKSAKQVSLELVGDYPAIKRFRL